jgi:large subunit ribosomal protein L4
MMGNQREPIAHVKTRGEVRGGGKKPWKQKGTGRARHGSSRSPIWVGGGVTHGPRNDKDYSRKINKKMKSKALAVILSQKVREGEILFVDNLKIDMPKTKDAKNVLTTFGKIKGFEKISGKRKNAAFIALDSKDKNTEKSFRNIGSVTVLEARNMNPLLLLNNKFLVVVNPTSFINSLS